ncbi:Mediator of RNA polymerase II transcription subunit 33A [Morella rubra]|uniref:Mediator of RNA polymerase II transcription subunit 33A n=1 Tax=Morella rubra TaxID=262757 RepID=A0A6A1WHD2_9ROSI|nr:Mediator of RNA polymerase II transcription subunit 33A [Morella rubra]
MGAEFELCGFEQGVLETLKRCHQRNESTLVSAMEVAKRIRSWGIGLPCPELDQVLVSHLCLDNNSSLLWKFVEQALSSGLLYPLHFLSLLTFRVLPHRRSEPKAYRLYLELLSRYALSFNPERVDASKDKIITGLIDSTLDDWGLHLTPLDRPSLAFGSPDHHDMDIDLKGSHYGRGDEHHETMRRTNSFMAIEVLAKLTESRKAMAMLHLVHLNMPEKFNGLLQRLQFLEANELVYPHLDSGNKLLAKLSANIQKALGFEYQLNKRQLIGMLVDIGSRKPVSCLNPEFGQSACWVPYDIYMENAMDGKELPIKSGVDVLTESIKTLQVFNQASWQETFLALWLSALRLVQRERDPPEGPIPRLEARLCVLLSIVPLAIANVLEDEAKLASSIPGATAIGSVDLGYGQKMNGKAHVSRKDGLISSLQVLGHFSGLLCPPAAVVDAANSAARQAARFITNAKNERGVIGGGGHVDTSIKAGGDMRHLIVEACIARNLIDTSAYLWPTYVSAPMISVSDSLSAEESPWSIFMEGAPLHGSLVNSLITTPASSLAEIEKLYKLALNGSEEEKSAAAKILCGASLSRGWNIQEHVVWFVVKLLSPPIPPSHTGSGSHLVDYMSMLSALLFGASSSDNVHILSLHGAVPEVAAALMPLCEAFGSIKPTGNKSSKDDEPSVYMVFSLAFVYLLRLWKFYRPPIEQCVSERGVVVRGELTLEYLLLLRNSSIASCQVETSRNANQSESTSEKPIYIDSYPNLRAWYCQNKSCIASTLAGLSSGDPVHQVANKILTMIYWKMTKSAASSGNSSTPTSSSACGSPASTGEDAYQRPMLPAWEVLEAIPFVLEAILTACAHGRLSSRDLTTGLRDLVDFLPASLATIVSYFSAEVTRGIWKPAAMNGKDWPSPAAILPSVESETEAILAAVGVDVPSCSTANDYGAGASDDGAIVVQMVLEP